jgi:hypothetical protein
VCPLVEYSEVLELIVADPASTHFGYSLFSKKTIFILNLFALLLGRETVKCGLNLTLIRLLS